MDHHIDIYATASHYLLDQCDLQSASCHNSQGCWQRSLLFTRHTHSSLGNNWSLWLYATVVCETKNGSYDCPYHQWWTLLTCSWPHLWVLPRHCQAWSACHNRCSPDYIHTIVCNSGSMSTNHCCSYNTKASRSWICNCSTPHPLEDAFHCVHALPHTASCRHIKVNQHSNQYPHQSAQCS